MSWYARITNLFRTERLSAEIDEEIAFHIAEHTDDLIASGMSPEEACREAARSFGNHTLQKEKTRDMDVVRWLERFLADLHYGARQLRLNPGFAAVAVLSLALGIGANSAIFQLINAVRLRSLPVRDAAQLVAVDTQGDFFQSGNFQGRHQVLTYAVYEQIVERQQAFSGLLAFGTRRFNLSGGGEARYAEALYVTPNFLEVFGVVPALGGWYPADKDATDCSGAGVLLNHTFWQSEYGGDPGVIGRNITLDGRSFPILGVTPASFTGPEPVRRFDVAAPLCADALFARDGKGRIPSKTAWWLTPIGRLKPGWTVERAAAHLRDISPAVFRETQPEAYRPDAIEKYLENKLSGVPAHAGVSSVREQYEDPLWILLSLTGLVLLIACANLANLLLARASAREREVALRQAVGASRGRLVAQLMSESLLLAGVGALLGAALAHFLSRALVLFLSSGGQNIDVRLGVDWRVFGFTAAIALAACLLFGLVPAIRTAGAAPADAMRGGRASATTLERNGLRRALVVFQVAFSLVLLVGALLFGQSLRNLLATKTGIESEGVLVASIDATLPNLEPEHRRLVFRQLEERFNSLPDVASAAAAMFTPFGNRGWNEDVHADDDDAATGGKLAWFNVVNPGYFRTLRTPLLAGRDFTRHDDTSAPQVAIVNEKLARDLFGDDDPIGRSFRYEAYAGEADPVYQIVGVVGNTKYNRLREDTRAIAFVPIGQQKRAPSLLSFVLRARGSLGAVMAGVRQQMAELDPALVVDFDVLEQRVGQSVMRERLMANLSGGFGLLAAILSTLGLYGVMSYMVARRRGEIGVRMALGAGTGDILGLVVGEAGRLLTLGLVLGLVGSFALSRYAESLLFGLEPNDAPTLALGCALLAATAFAAALLPAHRAARLQPAGVLRDE